MIQRTEHIKPGDLVLILQDTFTKVALFHKKTEVSIQFYKLYPQYRNYHYTDLFSVDYINTGRSNYQRVYKITEDNLTETELEIYRKMKKMYAKKYLKKKAKTEEEKPAIVQIKPNLDLRCPEIIH